MTVITFVDCCQHLAFFYLYSTICDMPAVDGCYVIRMISSKLFISRFSKLNENDKCYQYGDE